MWKYVFVYVQHTQPNWTNVKNVHDHHAINNASMLLCIHTLHIYIYIYTWLSCTSLNISCGKCCKHSGVYIYIYIHIYIYIYIYIHIVHSSRPHISKQPGHTYTCTYICTYMPHTHAHTYTNTQIHSYTGTTYTYTHIHTYTGITLSSFLKTLKKVGYIVRGCFPDI